MNQQEMTDIVSEELTHISRGSGVLRGWLRTYYNRRRRQDLSIGNITKEETLAQCINEIKKESPDWSPEYDVEYFKI